MTAAFLDLDDEDQEQIVEAKPTQAQVHPAPDVVSSSPSAPLWLVLLMAFGLGLLVGITIVGQYQPDRGEDRREQVEPDPAPQPKPDDKQAVDLKNVTLVVIHDKDVTNSTPEYAVALADDKFADWCKTSIKDLEILTTEDEIAKQVIASGKFQLPVVIAYSGKKYLWDVPLPRLSMESIRQKLEGK